MVKFINYYTGTTMYVAEGRVEEYVSAGHKLADTPKPKEKPKSKAKSKKTK